MGGGEICLQGAGSASRGVCLQEVERSASRGRGWEVCMQGGGVWLLLGGLHAGGVQGGGWAEPPLDTTGYG